MKKIAKWWLNNILKNIDDDCGTLSADYKYADEALEIRNIIQKIRRDYEQK